MTSRVTWPQGSVLRKQRDRVIFLGSIFNIICQSGDLHPVFVRVEFRFGRITENKSLLLSDDLSSSPSAYLILLISFFYFTVAFQSTVFRSGV